LLQRKRSILIVAPEKRKLGLIDELHAKCIDGWEDRITLMTYAKSATSDEKTRRAHEVVREWREGGYAHVFVDREAPVAIKHVESQVSATINKLEYHRLVERIDVTLNADGLLWSKRVEALLRSCGLKATPIAKWLAQFDHFEAMDVGRKVLKKLDILGSDEVVESFTISEHSLIGTNSYFTYFDDGDIGGSDASTKHTLLHLYPEDRVAEISQLLLAGGTDEAASIYLFADGLWSGAEFAKRLEKLKPLLSSTKGRRLRFKYSVVTDFGLVVARHLIRHNQLVDVDVEVQHDTRVINLLGDKLDQANQMQLTVSDPKELSRRLHSLVEPAIFQDVNGWGADLAKAREFLQDVGQQLAEHWVRREWGREGKSLDPTSIEERAAKFALGGGCFGLVCSFHQSVPKVTLPVLWLGGEIERGGRKLMWQPLLFDSRRA